MEIKSYVPLINHPSNVSSGTKIKDAIIHPIGLGQEVSTAAVIDESARETLANVSRKL